MLRAFHGDPKIKKQYLKRVKLHRLADEIVKGQYWANGKGCAVGCTIHSGQHSSYETELGIPMLLARLEDGIFEGLPNDKAQTWPERFLRAIKPGSDLSLVGPKFMVWLLTDVRKFARPDSKAAINQVIKLYRRRIKGDEPSEDDWKAAKNAATATAVSTAAADAAAYAAYAAYAYAYAAYAAYAYAYAATAAAYAAAAGRETARVKQSEKLLELLRSAPVSRGTKTSGAGSEEPKQAVA